MDMTTEKIACNFNSWLVDHGYLTADEALEDIEDMKVDFAEAYKVAPRLVNLLRDISDR